jgi:hypothetical protein
MRDREIPCGTIIGKVTGGPALSEAIVRRRRDGRGTMRLPSSRVPRGCAVALGCCLVPRPALQCCMPELTRRRYPERPNAGTSTTMTCTSVRRSGIPYDEDPWEWH